MVSSYPSSSNIVPNGKVLKRNFRDSLMWGMVLHHSPNRILSKFQLQAAHRKLVELLKQDYATKIGDLEDQISVDTRLQYFIPAASDLLIDDIALAFSRCGFYLCTLSGDALCLFQ
ncbi:hypothetical protein ACFE04_023160 [Oxalis oulophora]